MWICLWHLKDELIYLLWVFLKNQTKYLTESIPEILPSYSFPQSSGVIFVVQSLGSVRLFVTPRNVAHQAPLSMGFSRQEYWSELPFPPPGDLPNPGIEPRSPTQVSHIADGFFTSWATREAHNWERNMEVKKDHFMDQSE